MNELIIYVKAIFETVLWRSMIFSFHGGMLHGAIVLVIKSALLLENDKDVPLSSVARVFIKTFHLPQFFPYCSGGLQVFCVEVHCFSRLSLSLGRKANISCTLEYAENPTRRVTY